MNRSFSRKIVLASLGVAAALGAATAAQAHTDVSFSIGFPIAPAYVEPAPMVVQPAPVYVQPRPVVVQPRPVVVAPPAYVYERGWVPSSGRFERDRDWRRDDWRRRESDHREHRWDRSFIGRGWQ